MPDDTPPPQLKSMTCAELRAQGIDLETHNRVLAVLVDAVSRLEGGAAALESAHRDVEDRDSPVARIEQGDPSMLMTQEFLDAWRVGEDGHG